jgi:hypothetical protein
LVIFETYSFSQQEQENKKIEHEENAQEEADQRQEPNAQQVPEILSYNPQVEDSEAETVATNSVSIG